MRNYKHIFIWENRKRVTLLKTFKNNAWQYFQNITTHNLASTPIKPIENSEAQKVRTSLNLQLQKIDTIIIQAGINPKMSMITSGVTHNINVIFNIFSLYHYDKGYEIIADTIDRTIGVYNDDKWPAFLRTINPFFWLWLIIDWITSLPFKLIGHIGFNREKAEGSFIGRFLKLAFYVLTIVSLILGFWKDQEYIKSLIGFLKSLFQ